MTTEAEWAWVAGVIEGEGWFDKAHGAVAVEMTDRDVIEKLFFVTGGMGTLIGPRPTANGTKPKYIWAVRQKDEFLMLSEIIRPWLGERRIVALDIAVAKAKAKHGRKKWINQRRGRTAANDAFTKTAA